MFIGPKAFPEEFRCDVVAIARQSEAPISQIARDFGVSPAALDRWMKIADKEDGMKSGTVSNNSAKLREANRRRIRLRKQEADVMRPAMAYLSRDLNPKNDHLWLATRDAPIRVPVAVSCRVLNFSRQAYYQWAANPVPSPGLERSTPDQRRHQSPPLGSGVRVPVHRRRDQRRSWHCRQ